MLAVVDLWAEESQKEAVLHWPDFFVIIIIIP